MPAAQGVGIQVGRNVIGQIGHVNLSRDTVETYQKNGVTADGPVRPPISATPWSPGPA